MLLPQSNNANLVGILRPFFQFNKDPIKTIRITGTIAGAVPTNAELDTLTNITPATSPAENMLFIIEDDSPAATNMFLCMADVANDEWWFVTLTKAV